ncbi:MAG: hypothetical protein JXB39_12455 [Deltaproteobacteria bacterium]|nr:hypothetical protein [Deltaproteobacteria bacterium]
MTPRDQAQVLTGERHWDEAESAWARVASSARRAEDAEAWCRALIAAGDCAFRADRPVLALRHLVRVRQSCEPSSPLWALLGVQIAGILMELGELTASLRLFEQLDRPDAPDHVRAVLLDTRIGLHLVRGRVSDARGDLERLRRVAHAEAAVLFREGQIGRIEGRFSDATDALASAAVRVRDDPRFDGPLGAILLELAEVAMFREDHDDALSLLDEAEAAWCHARRRSGVFRTEAARMRLLALMGTSDVLTSNLERAVAFAAERELRLLEAELRLARGTCLFARDRSAAAVDLTLVLDMAKAMGAPHLAGRARLVLHDAPDGSAEALERACAELEETPPWRTRSQLALARARARVPQDREAALDMASTVFCQFAAMDLPADEARARILIWRLAQPEVFEKA